MATLRYDGIAALGLAGVDRILAAVASFSDFTTDNDPHGEHDCAVVELDGITVIWKIDYYDLTLTFLSPDPANARGSRGG